jgi:FkbM family methyltransferase
LSRGRQAHNLCRFLAWQIGSRLVPGPVAIDFVNEAKLLVRRSMTGATGNVYVGLHEFEDMAFVLHFLRPDDLFADIGANVGSFTVLAGAGAGARVIAFEPGVDAFYWLKQNIALNDLFRLVEPREQALGGRSGHVLFTSDLDTVNHVIPAKDKTIGEIRSVAMTTLDEALDAGCPSIIKIDVEGFETEVLRGAQETLPNPKLHCVVMELNGSSARYNFDETALLEEMLRHGFKQYMYSPFDRRLEAKMRNGAATAGNTIFVRDLPFVQQRLLEAKPFSVQGRKI